MDKELFPTLEGMKKELSAQKKPGIPLTIPGSPYLGEYVYIGPFSPPCIELDSPSYIEHNYTGKMGSASNMYYSLVFQLPKWNYKVVKADEWIDVSPTHAQYYQLVVSQRQALEGTIRSGLAEAAKAVADYELLQHDLRKYKEVLNYFTKKDEHSLKAMFIDQVDVHNGPMAMVQLVQRWPTLVADFQRIKDEDDTPEALLKYSISKAEAMILTTKNKLYKEWKEMFKEAAIERYQRIKGLVEGRRKSIHEYQEWVKPHIARFKSMKLGGERARQRPDLFKSYTDLTGQSTYTNVINLWAWKPMKAMEHRRAPLEREVAKKFAVDPADPVVVEHFIASPVTGLANKDYYPWLLNKTPDGKFEYEKIIQEVKDGWANDYLLDPRELHYIWMDIEVTRFGLKIGGEECEDITFYVRGRVLSQNIILVKLVELKCREREVERYIDEIIGTKVENRPIEELVKEEFPELFGVKTEEPKGLKALIAEVKKPFASMKKGTEGAKAAAGRLRFRGLYKYGPYEREFKERLSKQYLKPLGEALGKIAGLLESKMGVN